MKQNALKKLLGEIITDFRQIFMFVLTNHEYESLRTQIATLNNPGRGEHRKYLPFAFT